jgi:hypothetical protein
LPVSVNQARGTKADYTANSTDHPPVDGTQALGHAQLSSAAFACIKILGQYFCQ